MQFLKRLVKACVYWYRLKRGQQRTLSLSFPVINTTDSLVVWLCFSSVVALTKNYQAVWTNVFWKYWVWTIFEQYKPEQEQKKRFGLLQIPTKCYSGYLSNQAKTITLPKFAKQFQNSPNKPLCYCNISFPLVASLWLVVRVTLFY